MRIVGPGPSPAFLAARPRAATSSPDRVELSAGETATLYAPDGTAQRQASPYRGLREVFQRVEGWTVYSSLDRDYALNVVDPGGRPVARVDARVGGDHLAQVLLDPKRQRLYLLANRYQPNPLSTLVAVDLATGQECARKKLAGDEQVSTLCLTPEGPLALGRVGALGLTPNLEVRTQTAPPGFVPNRAHPLPDGRHLLLGFNVLKDGQVFSDYHPHAAIVGADGREERRIPDLKGWFHTEGERLVYVAYSKSELVTWEGGVESRRSLPHDATAALERPDGSLLVLHSGSGSVALQVTSRRGRVTEQHRFGTFPDLKSLLVHPNVSSVDLTVYREGKHRLHRVPLDGPGPLELVWGLVASDTQTWQEHDEGLFSSSQPFVPLALRDGRTLCVFADRTEVLDAEGRPTAPLDGPPEVAVRPFPGLGMGDFADPVAWARAQLPETIPGTLDFPAAPPSEAERRELLPTEGTARLQEAFWTEGGELSGNMPGLTARLVGEPARLRVLDGDRELSFLAPLGGATFTRALPLAHGLVAAACSDGSLVVYDGVSRTGATTARRYQVGSPVTRLEVSPAGRLLARGQDGSVLAVDVGRPLLRTPEPARLSGQVEERADATLIGAVRIRRNQTGTSSSPPTVS